MAFFHMFFHTPSASMFAAMSRELRTRDFQPPLGVAWTMCLNCVWQSNVLSSRLMAANMDAIRRMEIQGGVTVYSKDGKTAKVCLFYLVKHL